MKKFISFLLCLIMILSAFSVGIISASAASYANGDIIEYGNYPQHKITDADVIADLNKKSLNWKSYGYFSGTGDYSDGLMTAGNYMRYADVTYNGEKYRAVTFDTFRPCYTGYETSENASTYQDDNGYSCGKIYWFKFESIKWRILDVTTGLVISESIIDSQAFNNICKNVDGHYYGNVDCTYKPNDYIYSSIREWLNYDFSSTAFSSSQISNIQSTVLSDMNDIADKVFLPSKSEAEDKIYSGTYDRKAFGTDYAKCQGLYVSGGYAYWRLRSNRDSGGRSTYYFSTDGSVDYGSLNAYYTYYGVRPALKLKNLKSDISQSDNPVNPSEPDKPSLPDPTLGIKETDAIKGNSADNKKEYAYKSSVTFTANVPEGGSVQWYIDNQPAGKGSTLTVSEKTSSYTVKVVVTDKNGNKTADTENVTIKNSLWDKIVWFFKHLFNPGAYVIEQK